MSFNIIKINKAKFLVERMCQESIADPVAKILHPFVIEVRLPVHHPKASKGCTGHMWRMTKKGIQEFNGRMWGADVLNTSDQYLYICEHTGHLVNGHSKCSFCGLMVR